jgi:hypothetical protein
VLRLLRLATFAILCYALRGSTLQMGRPKFWWHLEPERDADMRYPCSRPGMKAHTAALHMHAAPTQKDAL